MQDKSFFDIVKIKFKKKGKIYWFEMLTGYAFFSLWVALFCSGFWVGKGNIYSGQKYIVATYTRRHVTENIV